MFLDAFIIFIYRIFFNRNQICCNFLFNFAQDFGFRCVPLTWLQSAKNAKNAQDAAIVKYRPLSHIIRRQDAFLGAALMACEYCVEVLVIRPATYL